MKRTSMIHIWGVLAVLLAMALVGGTALAAGRPVSAGQSAADVLAYWTPERIAGATPRDIERDTPPGLIDTNPNNGKGGGGNGGGKPGGGDGGDGGSTTVTGDPWSEVGAVQKTTGRAYFTMGSGNYVCSASVVDDGDVPNADGSDGNGRSLVLTAGHCVYDDARNAFATNWLFIPDYDNGGSFTNGTGPYGMWAASALVTTTAWAGGDFDHDYAFAVFTATDGNGDTLEQVVGEQAIAFDAIGVGDAVHAFGYPSEGKFKGNDLIYCAGPLVGLDPYDATTADGTTHYIGCDMNGGSSGGPWFTGFNETTGVGTVSSLVSYSYRGLKGALFGPQFGSYTSATHTAAKTATGNTLVSRP